MNDTLQICKLYRYYKVILIVKEKNAVAKETFLDKNPNFWYKLEFIVKLVIEIEIVCLGNNELRWKTAILNYCKLKPTSNY